MTTLALHEIKALIEARVREAGGPKLFADKVGLTPSAWGNVIHDTRKKPGPKMLRLLGYTEEPVRYRKAAKGRLG